MSGIFDGFIERFGKWKTAGSCKISDLPFISDIKKYLDEQESHAKTGWRCSTCNQQVAQGRYCPGCGGAQLQINIRRGAKD